MNNEYSKFDCSKIKMVIWDLDDTLWKGTLSEESVIIDNDKIELNGNIKKLIVHEPQWI